MLEQEKLCRSHAQAVEVLNLKISSLEKRLQDGVRLWLLCSCISPLHVSCLLFPSLWNFPSCSTRGPPRYARGRESASRTQNGHTSALIGCRPFELHRAC